MHFIEQRKPNLAYLHKFDQNQKRLGIEKLLYNLRRTFSNFVRWRPPASLWNIHRTSNDTNVDYLYIHWEYSMQIDVIVGSGRMKYWI